MLVEPTLVAGETERIIVAETVTEEEDPSPPPFVFQSASGALWRVCVYERWRGLLRKTVGVWAHVCVSLRDESHTPPLSF